MFTFDNLEVTRVLSRKEGIFAFAKYPTWHYEYNFLVEPDGKVKGNSEGVWLELSQEFSAYIQEKVKGILREKPYLVYA